jgi:hypothetical protein
MSLLQFLLARLAEEEQAAHGCPQWPWRLATMADENREDVFAGDTVLAANGEPVMEPFALSTSQQYAIARHVATWDPARALAECRAKREQLEELRALRLEDGRVARAMATVWADHPDYQPDWAG